MLEASVLNQVQAALYLPLVLNLGSLAAGLALVFGGVEVIICTLKEAKPHTAIGYQVR